MNIVFLVEHNGYVHWQNNYIHAGLITLPSGTAMNICFLFRVSVATDRQTERQIQKLQDDMLDASSCNVFLTVFGQLDGFQLTLPRPTQ